MPAKTKNISPKASQKPATTRLSITAKNIAASAKARCGSFYIPRLKNYFLISSGLGKCQGPLRKAAGGANKSKPVRA